MISLTSFTNPINVAVIGATGGLGRAFIQCLSEQTNVANITAFSRCSVLSNSEQNSALLEATLSDKVQYAYVDLLDEQSIQQMAMQCEQPLDMVIVATGLLHDGAIQPEKSRKDLNAQDMHKVLHINTVAPALIAQQLLPLMRKQTKTVFAVLSARVGSISDNRLGGWYSYRASKAALNMVLKNLAIEHKLKLPHLAVLGLHPGTVDTGLSKPFQRGVTPEKLFTPVQSAEYLLTVMDQCSAKDSGYVFAWDGKVIEP